MKNIMAPIKSNNEDRYNSVIWCLGFGIYTKALDDYIEYRKKQLSRRVLSAGTLASDRGALTMLRDYIKSQHGDLYFI